MSEDIPAGAAVVPDYAGHGDVLARRRSDEQVRAWVGETLVGLQERLGAEAAGAPFDALLVRCEFPDQRIIRAIENERFGEPYYAALIEDFDRKLVAAASAGRNASPEQLPGVLAAIERAFDERAAGVEAQLKVR